MALGGPVTTDRLLLTPTTPEDADDVAPALDDQQLHHFIGDRPLTLEQLRDRYRRWSKGSPDANVTWCNWIARHRDTGEVIATFQATVSAHSAELAWVVVTAHQRQGYAIEGAAALVKHLRDSGIHEFIAHIHPDHTASQRVARAVGMTATDEVHDDEVLWRRDRPTAE